MRFLFITLIVCVALLDPHLARGRESTSPIALTRVNIVDTTNGTIQRNATILIEGERITRVTVGVRPDTARLPRGTTIIDLANKYVIPGLWDMHVHSRLHENDPDWFFPLLIANGITGIRDMGSFIPLTRMRRLRDQTLAGKRIGPRMIIAGPLINGFNTIWDNAKGIPGETEAIRAVRMLKDQGADFIKVYALITSASYREVMRESRALGLPVAGQVPETIRAVHAAASGQRSIEHMDKIVLACSDVEDQVVQIKEDVLQSMNVRPDEAFLNQLIPTPEEIDQTLETLNPDRCKRLVGTLAEHRTAVVPTLALGATYTNDQRAIDSRLSYLPLAVRAAWSKIDAEMAVGLRDNKPELQALDELSRRLVRPLHDAGVPIMTGTHAAANTPFVYPGFSLHDELAALVRAGLSPLEALQAATIAPARFLGREEVLGQVAPQRFADLVVLDANPLENIANTRKIHAVVLNGRLLQRPALDRLLHEVREN